MDMTLEQLAEQIIFYGKIAGGISAIIALLALIISPRIKAMVDKRKQHDDEQAKHSAEMLKALNDIQAVLKSLTDDVASLQRDRLDQAHDFYCEQGWIESTRLQALNDWYSSYKAKGFNHLAEHWLQDLEALPSSPPERK